MNRFDAPLYLPLSSSRLLLRWWLLVHVGALSVVLINSVTPVVGLCGIVLLALHAAWWRRTRLHLSPDGVSALLSLADGRWRVTLRDGSVHEAVLSGNPFVSRTLTAFSLRLAGGRTRHVLIASDSAPPDVYRRLRVRLRFRAGAADDG